MFLLLLSFSSGLGFSLLRGRTHLTLSPLQFVSHRRQSSKFQQCECVSGATVLHKQLQHGSLPQCTIPLEQAALQWAPCRVTSPASIHAPAWAPLSWGHRSCQETYSSADFLQAHRFFQSHPPTPAQGSPCTAGAQLLHRDLHHGLLRTLSSSAWSTSGLSFCTLLGSWRAAMLTGFHFSPAIAVVHNHPPVLKYSIPAALPPPLMG